MPSIVKPNAKKKLIADLSVPSKTFLLGEYLILIDGPALILATSPRFHLKVFESDKTSHIFHPQSPAGLLLKNQKVQNCFFEFQDPYGGSGGMGASSAQFVLVESFLNRETKWQDIYNKFRSLSVDQPAWDRPSGGDVVTQFSGGLTYFKPPGELNKLSWDFDDLDFSLFKTSQKLATHEHLKDIQVRMLKLQEPDLFKVATEAVEQAFAGIKSKDSSQFVKAFSSFADLLSRVGFVSDLSLSKLDQMKQHPEILAAKGCGAMGADVLCVLHRPESLSLVRERVSQMGLKYLGSSGQIDSSGLRFDSDPSQSV